MVNQLEVPSNWPLDLPRPAILKTYRGTFTVKDKRVILNGEPTEPAGVNSYKIVGRNLKGPWGLWVRQPAAKK